MRGMSLKSNSFINKFFNNWPVKSISLLAAIILYTLNSFNTLDTVNLEVPLQVILPESYALSSPHRKTITFTITAQAGKGIGELTADDFQAMAVLPEDKIAPGDIKVYIQEERRGKALDFQGILPLDITMQPPMVVVEIEARTEKQVPVIPQISGGPEEGFKIYDKRIFPERVIISGAASRLKLIEAVKTETISYNGYRKDFFVNAPLVLEDPLVKIKDFISVEFTGFVIEMLSERTIRDITLQTELVNPGLQINGNLPKGVITIKASDQVLRNLRKESVRLLVDCANINQPGRYELKTTPDIPVNSTLIFHTPQSVKVDFIVRR